MAGGIPPPSLNHRATPDSATLAPAAASSLDKPNAIAAQNLLSPSRPATGGRPGEGNGALPERSERRRFNLVIVTPHEALRRPLESAAGGPSNTPRRARYWSRNANGLRAKSFAWPSAHG